MLEDEPDLTFLGMDVVLTGCGLETELVVPGFDHICANVSHHGWINNVAALIQADRWRFRSPASAGSSNVLASGFTARLHSAAQLSFPLRRAQASVLKVFAICIVLKLPIIVLMGLLKVHSTKYPIRYTQVVGRTLVASFAMNSEQGVRSIIRLLRMLDRSTQKDPQTVF